MRKPIIAGNWKMYKTLPEAKSFMGEISGIVPAKDKMDSVVCAPALFLESLVSMSKEFRCGNRRTKYAFRRLWCFYRRN